MLKQILRKVTPDSMWSVLQKINAQRRYSPIKKMKQWGVNFKMIDDPYSPLPVFESLKENERRWNKPSELAGLNIDLEKMKSDLKRLIEKHYNDVGDFVKIAELKEYGVGFQQSDSIILFCMLMENKPTKYFEVGAGMSTFIADYTRKKYKDKGIYTQIKTVEPEPFDKLYSLKDVEIIKDAGQNIPLDFFDSLNENDVMFIDTTHVIKIDGEVNYLILEILPRLKKGVLIHFHDIPFPYNFPFPADYWILNRTVQSLDDVRVPMYWTEPMMLQAFLAFNDSFRIEMSLPIIRHNDENFLKETIPGYETIQQNPNVCSSLWIRKIK